MVTSSFPDFSCSQPSFGARGQLTQLGYLVLRKLPENANWAFEPAFFNRKQFLDLNSAAPLQSFFLVQVTGEQSQVRAVLNFRIGGEKATSLSGAPFGGPDFAESLPAEALKMFLAEVMNNLQESGIKVVEIRMPAIGIFARFGEVNHLLRQLNFSVALSEVNHHLPADIKTFGEKLHPSAKRRLKKLVDHGFRFCAEPHSEAEAIFRFIEACREEKGYYLSLTYPQLLEAMQAAPGRYQFFSVRCQGKLAAATIGVLSAAGVLYNYAPAHAAHFNSYSPVILLTHGLVSWCQRQNLEILDLGTSTLLNQPNQPLIRFKERLGGIASEKLTFVKQC